MVSLKKMLLVTVASKLLRAQPAPFAIGKQRLLLLIVFFVFGSAMGQSIIPPDKKEGQRYYSQFPGMEEKMAKMKQLSAKQGVRTSSTKNKNARTRSLAAGGEWTRVTNGLVGGQIDKVWEHNGIFIGLSDTTYYRSTDQGDLWVPLVSPVTLNQVYWGNLHLNNGRLYAYSTNSNKEAFFSDDMGLSWTLWNQLSPSGALLFVPGKIIKGSSYSTDNGVTWSGSIQGNQGIVGATDNYYFAVNSAAPKGLLRSSDLITWQPINNGLLNNQNNYSFGRFYTVGSTLFVHDWNAGQLKRSANNGAQWTVPAGLPGGVLYQHRFNDMYVYGNTIYLSTELGLYTSVDDGLNWQQLPGIIDLVYQSSVIANGKLYASISGEGIYQSEDMGQTWTIKKNQGLTAYIHGPITKHTSGLYLGGASGLFHSADGGQTWQKRHGLLGEIYSTVFVGDRIIALCSNIYNQWTSYSDDFGYTWKKSSALFTGANTFTLHEHQGKLFIVGHESGVSHIYISNDAGATWTRDGLSFNTTSEENYVWGFASKGDTLFIANDYLGVMYTTNFGSSWTRPANAQPQGNIYLFGSFGVKVHNNKLYLMGDNGGLLVSNDWAETWTVSNTGLSLSTVSDLEFPAESMLMAGYPDFLVSDNDGVYWEVRNEGLPKPRKNNGYAYSTPKDIHIEKDKVFVTLWPSAFHSGNGLYVRDLNTLINAAPNSISGKLYFDDNANGVHDAGERPAINTLVQVQPGNLFFPTDANGNYTAYVRQGTYTLSPVAPPYSETITPVQHTITFATDAQTSANRDFAITVTPVADMKVVVVNTRGPRPGFEVGYTVSYKNSGTVTRSGTVQVTVDNKLDYVSSKPVPTNITGNVLEFDYTDLDPSASGKIEISMKVPANIALLNQLLTTEAKVYPVIDDFIPADNISTIVATIRGSYDPNDKQVTPEGNGSAGYIPAATNALLYTVRFQNMGTAEAINVEVKDQLDVNLDVSTFSMVASSHANNFNIVNGEVTWTFNTIDLPYAALDEPGSHGFITYSIAPKPNLAEGTIITNTADIYFDFNPAIVTNTVVNTLKDPIKIETTKIKSGRNTEVILPITATGFTNILSTQFSIRWNAAVAQFVSAEDFTLTGINNSIGTTQFANGVATFSWSSPGLLPVSVNAGDTLFTLHYKLIGNYGETTDVTIGDVPLTLEVVDQNYQTFETVTTNGSLTIETDVLIKGKILFPNNEPVQNVSVAADAITTTTDVKGEYNLIMQPGPATSSYTLLPTKNNDPKALNGIDVADITAMRRHILQTQLLTSPYQLIAADVNQSKSISTLDIVFVQALILGKTTAFPTNTFWTFVPADYSFSNPLSPYSYPVTKSLSLTELEALPSVDFTAIKLGDVNDSRDNTQSGRIAATETVTFDIRQEIVLSETQSEKNIEIPIRVKDFNAISGYQFTISWDADKLEYVDVENKMTPSLFGNQEKNGALSVLWDDTNGKSSTLADNNHLLVLKFKSKNGGSYQDVTINSAVTEAKVYNASLEPIAYKVTKTELEKSEMNLMTGVYPNPFTDELHIRFYCNHDDLVTIKVSDITGRAVFNADILTLKGINEWIWPGTDVSGNNQSAGIYIIHLQTSRGVEIMKVVKR